MKHELKIISLHDAQAYCTCGKWRMTRTGPATELDIRREFNRHLPDHPNAPLFVPIRDIPKAI